MILGSGNRLGERIEGSGMQVPGLEAHDCRTGTGLQRSPKRGWVNPSLMVRRNNLRGPEAQEAQGHVQALVALGPDEDTKFRRALESPGVDIPTDGGQLAPSGRRERREVGHACAGRESDVGANR
ncbi:hypothetical protein AHiyo8_14160 [Arthrobacter sp. Hiyo8]|nr:hypothetical protein AHiyo8_14160 [Arthrobacter sp. Hiyo8]